MPAIGAATKVCTSSVSWASGIRRGDWPHAIPPVTSAEQTTERTNGKIRKAKIRVRPIVTNRIISLNLRMSTDLNCGPF